MKTKSIPTSEILTTAETSKVLKICEKSLLRLVKKGKIPHFRVGNLVRFNRAELLAWASSSRN